MATGTNGPFVHGDAFDDTWAGLIATAEVVIQDAKLHLRNLAIFSSPAARTRIGVQGLRRWLERVKLEARKQGFEILTPEFDRVTGANPGRSGVIVIALKSKQTDCVMTKAQKEIIDRAAHALNEHIEEVLKDLASAGLGPADGYRLLRHVLGMSYEEAKRRVIESGAWARMRDDINKLHDDAEAAANDMAR